MRKYIGFSILTFFTLVLFLSSFINLFYYNFMVAFAFIPVVGFALVTIVLELRRSKDYGTSYPLLGRKAGYDFIATFLGAVITFFLSVNIGLGAVLASGIVGMLAALFFKPYAVPAFCGSFVGMSSPELMDPQLFIVASTVVSVIFVLCKDVFNGYGGKLGTMALSAALICSFISGAAFLEPPVYGSLGMFLIVVFSILGALVTYIISVRFEQGPVMGSGFIGLIAGAVLPIVFPESGGMLAVVAFGASFVGMSSPKKMPEESHIMLAGLFFGLIFIFSAPYFQGAGGKLGTIAFASVLSVYGIRHVLSHHVFKNA